MKKTIFYVFVLLPLLFSCTGNQEELKKLKAENEQLELNAREKDEIINDFIQTFNEIEDNLAVIKEKENIIRVNAGEGDNISSDAKDRINEDVLAIYKLMLKNKKKLAELNNKLDAADVKVAEFQKLVSRLNKRIEEKNKEIASLRSELAAMHINIENLGGQIDSLEQESHKKSQIIDEQTEELNTAYYVFGDKKELKEHEVITKQGGFIGIGGIAKLKGDFNQDYFTKIDIRETLEIPISAKKVKIITTHPEGSYELSENEGITEKIIINDPEKFWSVSKYLVIIIN